MIGSEDPIPAGRARRGRGAAPLLCCRCRPMGLGSRMVLRHRQAFTATCAAVVSGGSLWLLLQPRCTCVAPTTSSPASSSAAATTSTRHCVYYTAQQVAQRDGRGGRRAWFTLGSGVFDLTEYTQHHPGGRRILEAAGGALEPFWAFWPAHYERADRMSGTDTPRPSTAVANALRGRRIGELLPSDAPTPALLREIAREAWATEPTRLMATRRLITRRPFQAEPGPIPRSFITPNESFYVRNHGPVPALGSDAYRLQCECECACGGGGGGGGGGGTAAAAGAALSLAELEDEHRFRQYTLSATLQCTGNRLDELAAGPRHTAFGEQFAGSKGFISNAVWRGPRLVDVMMAQLEPGAALPPADSDEDWHLEMEGADGFGVSIPWSYVADPERRPVLLATRMNHVPLPPDHGYPVRVLVPGAVGCRSVKWVVRLSLVRGMSESPWNRCFYRGRSAREAAPQVGPESVRSSVRCLL
jgi:sulfite oxidase